MAAVGALQHTQLPPQAVAIDVQPNPQDQRVVEAASHGFFAGAKETLSRVWSATVIGFQVAGDKISFVFFRILEWIHPSLGPRVEVAFLRITNIWQAIKDAWKAEETRKQMEDLSVQNLELTNRVRDYEQIVIQNGQLTDDRNRLQQDNLNLLQAKNFAEEALRQARQQEQNILGREEAVVQYRDIVVLKNQRLEEEKAQLIRERDEAQQALAPFLAGNQQLREQLAEAQQQIADLQLQIPQQREMQQQFAVVADAIGKVQRIGPGAVDHALDGLLSLLNEHLPKAHEKLDYVLLPRRNADNEIIGPPLVEPTSTAGIALQSFRRIVTSLQDYTGQVALAMQVHGNYQAPVNRLLNLVPLVVGEA
jgi:hypothetical protein